MSLCNACGNEVSKNNKLCEKCSRKSIIISRKYPQEHNIKKYQEIKLNSNFLIGVNEFLIEKF